jgi:hypothetical protein
MVHGKAAAGAPRAAPSAMMRADAAVHVAADWRVMQEPVAARRAIPLS